MRFYFLIALAVMLFGCNPPVPKENRPDFPATEQLHRENAMDAYVDMLRRRVNRNGDVHYAGILREDRALKNYIAFMTQRYNLVQQAPFRERLAYWINLHNALAIELVVSSYPIASVLDIGYDADIHGKMSYQQLSEKHPNHPFRNVLLILDGKALSLESIRDSIIRGEFQEPRALFALVDGTASAPRLRRQLYKQDNLEAELQVASREFLSSPTKNILNPNNPRVSPIFEWYRSDFGETDADVAAFINEFIPVEILPGAEIEYLSYDWTLNGY